MTTYRDMVEKPEVVELIDDEVATTNETLRLELEQITRLRLLPEGARPRGRRADGDAEA